MADCEACDGSGDCVQCSGKGYKDNSSIDGAYDSVCMACDKSGKCNVCRGTGEQPETRY